MIKVIAFDIFGTIFDLSKVNKQEIREYVRDIRKPEWTPLSLPKSWETLPAFTDAKEGIDRLKQKYIVVTCSNGPLGLQIKLCKFNSIGFDGHIPLELNKVYKTNPKAYMTVCEVLDVEPEQVMMVTANRDFGDLEESEALGMSPMLIRHKDTNCKDVLDLAKLMGC